MKSKQFTINSITSIASVTHLNPRIVQISLQPFRQCSNLHYLLLKSLFPFFIYPSFPLSVIYQILFHFPLPIQTFIVKYKINCYTYILHILKSIQDTHWYVIKTAVSLKLKLRHCIYLKREKNHYNRLSSLGSLFFTITGRAISLNSVSQKIYETHKLMSHTCVISYRFSSFFFY